MIGRVLRLGTEEAEIADEVADDLSDQLALSRGLDPLAGVLRRGLFPRDSTMLDVGTDLGFTTILLARAVPQGRVVAFCGSAQAETNVRANLQANAIVNVDLADVQAASGPGSAALGIDRHDPQLRNVSFVRIAYGGREPDVLAGASRLIDRENPTIFLEFNAWNLNAIGDHSPAGFAKALWRTFHVLRLEPDGYLREAPDDPLRFLYEHLLEEGCFSELVLKKRPGSSIADEISALTTGQEIKNLRAENAAMRNSTSWQITKPIRWMKSRLGS